MTPEHLAELQAAWPGQWKPPWEGARTVAAPVGGAVVIATTGGEYPRRLEWFGPSNARHVANGHAFAECRDHLIRQLHAERATVAIYAAAIGQFLDAVKHMEDLP